MGVNNNSEESREKKVLERQHPYSEGVRGRDKTLNKYRYDQETTGLNKGWRVSNQASNTRLCG